MRTAIIGAAGVLLIGLVLFVVVGFMAPRTVEVQHRRFIGAEPDAVWEVVSDSDRWARLLGERSNVEEIEVREADEGLGTERIILFSDGDAWRDIVTVYEPPYDLRFTGVYTPGVQNWQNHILLQPGARGGTVATFNVSYEPQGFWSRAASQLYFAGAIRNHAIHFLENTAEELGVRRVNVDEYAMRYAQERARESVDAAQAPQDEGPTDGGTEADPDATDETAPAADG